MEKKTQAISGFDRLFLISYFVSQHYVTYFSYELLPLGTQIRNIAAEIIFVRWSPPQSHWYAWSHGSDASPLGVMDPYFLLRCKTPLVLVGWPPGRDICVLVRTGILRGTLCPSLPLYLILKHPQRLQV